jgi:GMP synthase (glutamine-hydrolysing)
MHNDGSVEAPTALAILHQRDGGAIHADQEAEHPWLREEKALLPELVEREVPLLGVCLGSQLLAEAAGAKAAARRVRRSAGTTSRSPTPVRMTCTDGR